MALSFLYAFFSGLCGVFCFFVFFFLIVFFSLSLPVVLLEMGNKLDWGEGVLV